MLTRNIYKQRSYVTIIKLPINFVWKDKEHEWCPRKKGFSNGRLQFVPPRAGELFYLRMMLNYVKGLVSYARSE